MKKGHWPDVLSDRYRQKDYFIQGLDAAMGETGSEE